MLLVPVTTSAPIPPISNDLDTRLAEIAGQLSISNGSAVGGAQPPTSVNWTGSLSLATQKPQSSTSPFMATGPHIVPQPTSTMNPWGAPPVLQPTQMGTAFNPMNQVEDFIKKSFFLMSNISNILTIAYRRSV